MYKIINHNTGETAGITESPTYIRLSQNGCYVLCKSGETPQGVAFASQPYNLFGKEPMSPDLPTVLVTEVDGGNEVDALKADNKYLSDQLTQSQLALCDVYEQALNSDSQLTETQLALCDVYEQLIAVTSNAEGGETTNG